MEKRKCGRVKAEARRKEQELNELAPSLINTPCGDGEEAYITRLAAWNLSSGSAAALALRRDITST